MLMLHPFMPFVTEEIWEKFPGTEGSIMQATFPADAPAAETIAEDTQAEAAMQIITQVITGIRNIRGEMDLPPAQELTVELQSEDQTVRATVADHQDIILNLARVKDLSIAEPGKKPASAATTFIEGGTLWLCGQIVTALGAALGVVAVVATVVGTVVGTVVDTVATAATEKVSLARL